MELKGAAVRCLVTGTDDEGRSRVVEVLDAPETAGADSGVGLWTLSRLAAEKASRPIGHGEHLDLGVEPDAVHWLITRWPVSDEWTAFHHTDSVDLDLVMEGSIELRLDDGDHHLEAGDCVVVTGVDHAWRSGPDGCVMSVVVLGTPPPAADG
jgi:hypothetical protein